jgi:long-chain acyl-CoA synthetase
LLDRIAEAAGSEGFPDLRTVLYGAAPSSTQTRERALAALGPVLHQVYGLTETSGSITELTPADASSAAGSVGRPYPWVTLEIRDPASAAPVATGTPGEVWTRSAQHTPGYAGRPVATAALVTADGWLRTGDVGWLDGDGLLHLTDRLSDLIVTGGDNVSPAEVEEVLRRHPSVADASVFGLPDPRWGEAVTAAVVLREGETTTEAELAAHAAGGLAAYKRPQRIHLRTELPRNAAGKVLRRALKETYAP